MWKWKWINRREKVILLAIPSSITEEIPKAYLRYCKNHPNKSLCKNRDRNTRFWKNLNHYRRIKWGRIDHPNVEKKDEILAFFPDRFLHNFKVLWRTMSEPTNDSEKVTFMVAELCLEGYWARTHAGRRVCLFCRKWCLARFCQPSQRRVQALICVATFL